jgi:hypothetical protein
MPKPPRLGDHGPRSGTTTVPHGQVRICRQPIRLRHHRNRRFELNNRAQAVQLEPFEGQQNGMPHEELN